jgi:hypothetical protein
MHKLRTLFPPTLLVTSSTYNHKEDCLDDPRLPESGWEDEDEDDLGPYTLSDAE